METFPGFFLTSLGQRFLAAFYRGLVDCPLGLLLVAETDGDVVGFVGGTTDESAFFAWLKRVRRTEFVREAVIAALRNPKAVRRLWRAQRRDADSEESTYDAVLLSIGVSPAIKRQGVGAELARAFIRRLDTIGVDGFCLTTDARDNEDANSFYRSLGMHLTRTYSTPEGRTMNEYAMALFPGTAGSE